MCDIIWPPAPLKICYLARNKKELHEPDLYSMGLHPLITRPTRITCQSKTLIDNIFTSDVTSHIQSGLLINDTSDHLPIFQMTDIGIHGNTNNSVYNKKRIVTDRNICEIISELEKTEWGEILNSDDVNVSYETFVNKLTDIYRKSVLLSQVR